VANSVIRYYFRQEPALGGRPEAEPDEDSSTDDTSPEVNVPE